MVRRRHPPKAIAGKKKTRKKISRNCLLVLIIVLLCVWASTVSFVLRAQPPPSPTNSSSLYDVPQSLLSRWFPKEQISINGNNETAAMPASIINDKLSNHRSTAPDSSLITKVDDSNSTNLSMLPKSALIQQDYSYLLDFAIIGHSKCGTTSLRTWLELAKPQLEMIPRESKLMREVDKNPIPAIQEARKRSHAQPGKGVVVFGYKNPNDILQVDSAMVNLQRYFPSTKLIIGVRHPILWFESFYNFRLFDSGMNVKKFPHANQLIGPCGQLEEHVCTDHARFHLQIAAALGLPTSLDNDKENKNTPTLSNPVFFYEIQQLFDAHNATVSLPAQATTTTSSSTTWNTTHLQEDFQRDLAVFLNVPALATIPIPNINPYTKHGISKKKQKKLQEFAHLKMDICEAQYNELRSVLLHHAKDTATWVKQVLLRSDYADDDKKDNSRRPKILVSSKEYLVKVLLESYYQDPCNDQQELLRRSRRKQESLKS